MPTGSAYTTPDDWSNASPLASARFQKLAEDVEFLYRRLQKGKQTINFAAASVVSGTVVTFPTAFAAAPVVQLTPESTVASLVCLITAVTATSVTFNTYVMNGASISGAGTIHWVAVKA